MMTDLLQILALAILQGITEFLPISSSAHLLLPGIWLDWPAKTLAFDVAVHAGTLAAAMVYFRNDLRELFFAWCASLCGRHSTQSRLAWLLILATLPAGICGLLLHEWIGSHLRGVLTIAVTTVVFALLLWCADRFGKRSERLDHLRWAGALGIGLGQMLALVPGVSRSGICLSVGLLLGLRRTDAARFSFLLAMPIIAAAAGLQVWELRESPPVHLTELAVAFGVSAVCAHLSIDFFLRFVERVGLLPFVIYRLVLGGILFVFVV